MSVGHPHSRKNEKHPAEIRKLEASPDFQRMWARPFKVTVTRQIPDSAGYSVMGDEYFIDTDLHHAVLAGTWSDPRTGGAHDVRLPGLTPMQVLECLLRHERTEKCLTDALNNIESYQDSHEMATSVEHTLVRSFGGSPYLYERALAPIIAWNQAKPLNNVPPNLSCAPLLDDPDAQDKITIKVLNKLGVEDSFKESKKTAVYGPATGPDHCSVCSGWMAANRQVELSPCRKIEGAVRNAFWCKRYEAMNAEDATRGVRQSQSVAQSSPASSGGGDA